MKTELGPVYGVELLDTLPLNGGTMRQALPSRSDLEGIQNYRQGLRVVAGYEVLMEHYHRAISEVERLRTFCWRANKALAGRAYDPQLMDDLAKEAARAAGGAL
jgi:hypothetical protein